MVSEFNRLTGRKLLSGLKRAPIEVMIDEATGYQKEIDKRASDDMQAFMTFVFTVIWLPLLSEFGVVQLGVNHE